MGLQGNNFGFPLFSNFFQLAARRPVNFPATNAGIPTFFPFASPVMDTFAFGHRGLDLSQQDASKINVVAIDDFTPEKDQVNDKGEFFNHGETVTSILQSGGTAKDLAKDVQVNKINIDSGEAPEQRVIAISNALSQVIAAARKDPSKVDVVNLSQQDAAETQYSVAVRQKIKMLQDMGIPVVVAADNLGPQSPNQLAYRNAFVVQSTDKDGNLLQTSGPGNYRAVGRSTSFVAPQLAPLIGFYKQKGYSIEQIHQLLQQQGGSFSSADFQDAFSANKTV